MGLFGNKRQFRIQINYKSGHKQIVWVDKMKRKELDGKLTELEWTDMYPKPLHMGINEIESIWIL